MSEPKKKAVAVEVIGWGGAFLIVVGLVAVGLPNFIKARSTRASNPCINNLRQIDSAACQFALENHLTNGTPIRFPDDLTNYIKLNRDGKIPGYPQGGIYTLKKVGEPPTCSLGTSVVPMHVLP